MEIPDIEIDINDVRISDIQVYQPPGWVINPPQAIPPSVPITEQVGVPIVDMPGCVEAHEQNSSKEKSGILSEDDPKGVKVYCDAGMPSFNPIDYNKNKLKYEYKAPVPAVESPEQPEVKAPEAKTDTKTPIPKCPTREQELLNPVGKILEGNKKITGYELVGKKCLMVTEQLTIPDQIVVNIPNAGKVTATASIAVVATTSALLAKPLADLLLKVVKPTVKKVLKKIATLRGKTLPVQSTGERLAEQRQRNQAVKKLRSVRPLKK
jgi:hypothetical protein